MSKVLYVVDAFTKVPFSGNPAAVSISEAAEDETWMKNVAREMNLAETAFLHPIDGGFSLRWLTPTIEVDLCGHATLASAFVLWHTQVVTKDAPCRFLTRSGWLTCTQVKDAKGEDWIRMDFPALPCERCDVPDGLSEVMGFSVSELYSTSMDYLVEVASEMELAALSINFDGLAKYPMRGIIVTCKGSSSECDFLSRFFAPAAGVNEDPVTGSAHCALGPYWSVRLGKDVLNGFQASDRGGTVRTRVAGDRVHLEGQAVLMSRVQFT